MIKSTKIRRVAKNRADLMYCKLEIKKIDLEIPLDYLSRTLKLAHDKGIKNITSSDISNTRNLRRHDRVIVDLIKEVTAEYMQQSKP